MSFDYMPGKEFPCAEDRTYEKQVVDMSDSELAHQLTKSWGNKAVTEALLCGAASRLLLMSARLDTLESSIKNIASHIGASRTEQYLDEDW